MQKPYEDSPYPSLLMWQQGYIAKKCGGTIA